MLQVDAAHEQLAGADAGLEDQAELAVGDPVVDDLDDRAELAGKVVEDQRVGAGDADTTTASWCATSVGKPASAGCAGSQRIPSVCGGWRRVQAVFQKIDEKPSATLPQPIAARLPGGDQQEHAAAGLEGRQGLVVEPAGRSVTPGGGGVSAGGG